jgi:hypothetical protein
VLKIGLGKGICFVSSFTIFCKICFVTAEFWYQTVSDSNIETRDNQNLKTCNFSHKILCLAHEITLDVNWQMELHIFKLCEQYGQV